MEAFMIRLWTSILICFIICVRIPTSIRNMVKL